MVLNFSTLKQSLTGEKKMRAPKKLTGKVLGFDKETVLELAMKDKNKEVPLYDIVGAAFKATLIDPDDGKQPYFKFMGSFRGTNKINGEMQEGNSLILPEVAANVIASALMLAESGKDGVEGEEEKSVSYAEISLTVSARYDKDSATSYVYACDVHNSTDGDLFERLEKLVPKQIAGGNKKK